MTCVKRFHTAPLPCIIAEVTVREKYREVEYTFGWSTLSFWESLVGRGSVRWTLFEDR